MELLLFQENFVQPLTRSTTTRHAARDSSLSAAYFFYLKRIHAPFRQYTLPFPPSFRWRARGAQKRLIVGTSGFRMNKHCLNRDSGSLGARVPSPPSPPTAPCTISRSFRSEIRDFTSAYYARRTAAPRAGALTLFEGRRTFLRS